MKGRPPTSSNHTYLTWKFSIYDEELKAWKSKKYITIAEIKAEHDVRLHGDTVQKLLKGDILDDENKQYTKNAFWNKYKHIKLEKIHEPPQMFHIRE